MAVRLVASDLDGTLFSPDHVPAARTVEAINALVDSGIIVVAATGRSWHGGAKLATSTGANLAWFIGSNGGHRLSYETGDLEERLIFDASEVEQLRTSLEDNLSDIGLGYEHHDGFWFGQHFTDQFPQLLNGKRRESTVDRLRTDDIGKIFVSHRDLATSELIDLVGVHVLSGANATTSGANFVEITPAGADKGSALARLCGALGIAAGDVVAFGDNYNDMTMLEWAGRGVAMGNAEPAVKAIADEVTQTNADFGVARVLEELLT